MGAAPRPLPASPDGSAAASVVRTARVRHPPAPECGRSALPANLVVMTVTYAADRASPAPAGTMQALRVLLPAHYAHHPALQQDALLQLTLDERRSPPAIRHIATAHEPWLVLAPRCTTPPCAASSTAVARLT